MKIAFFTEGRYYGKVPVNHPNMRTDLAWIHLLNADHIYMYDFSLSIKYDLGIIIIPKNRIDVPIHEIQAVCKKIAIMQEGPCDYWTDYTLHDQIAYLELLSKANFILCHNQSDVNYYLGLTKLPVYIMPTVMVEENLNSIIRKSKEQRSGAIIGGNMCSWYNGMVSFLIAKHYSDKITAPSMGRKVPGENHIEGLDHLPFLNWQQWMDSLNEFQVGVHMMPTVAAGTFSLNCAYLGIPCIGNQKVDTQEICHPALSVGIHDVDYAVHLINKLKNEDKFYKNCSEIAIANYNMYFHSSEFKRKMNIIFEEENIGGL